MKKNKSISAAILTIFLFLVTVSAEAGLLHLGRVSGVSFYPLGYGIAVRDVVSDSQEPEPSSLALPVLGFLDLSGFIRCRGISDRG